jgi:hypothetical protein
MTKKEYLAALQRRHGQPQGGNATEPWVKAMVERKRTTGASRADLKAYEDALRERNLL